MDSHPTNEQRYFLQIMSTAMDGEATEEELRFFEQKIRTCNHCRTWYECEQSVREIIKRYSAVNPPQDLIKQICSRIGIDQNI